MYFSGPDMHMNGNCAGGTGAFIDQMAILLGCDIKQMNDMALQYLAIYPIASRCGVFSKTDVQNLISLFQRIPAAYAEIA
jgi:activator of 2-hydroxyglutaryl-CoA dehydratase